MIISSGKIPEKTGRTSQSPSASFSLVPSALGNDGLVGYAIAAGSHRQCTTQGPNPLANACQPEPQPVIRAQSAAIVAHTHQSAAVAAALHPRKLIRGFNGDVDGCRACVAKNIRQGFLNGTVNRQIGGLSGLAERRRNRGFDHDAGMSLAPQAQESTERFAKAKLRQSNRPQLF